MYCTSTQVKLLRDGDFISFEQNGIPKFPRPYIDFMKTYGIGTYGGAICITAPDFDILKSFAEYHFWKFKDAPITEEQFCECVAIGNSIDGDYIAIHSQVKGYILFPRNSGIIKLFPYDEERFIYSINKIGKYLYDEDLENYFEPVGAQSLFLHASSEITNALIERFKAMLKGDYMIENEYITLRKAVNDSKVCVTFEWPDMLVEKTGDHHGSSLWQMLIHRQFTPARRGHSPMFFATRKTRNTVCQLRGIVAHHPCLS